MSTNRQSNRNRKSAAPSTVAKAAAPIAKETDLPAAPVATAAPARAGEVTWQHDYDYIFKDLRKLLIVSLSLFAVIIILGFFL